MTFPKIGFLKKVGSQLFGKQPRITIALNNKKKTTPAPTASNGEKKPLTKPSTEPPKATSTKPSRVSQQKVILNKVFIGEPPATDKKIERELLDQKTLTGFLEKIHPDTNTSELSKEALKIIKNIDKNDAKSVLKEASRNFLARPEDPEKSLYLLDKIIKQHDTSPEHQNPQTQRLKEILLELEINTRSKISEKASNEKT